MTTEVVGNCGFSVGLALPGKVDALSEYPSGSAPWLTFEETDSARYMDSLARHRGEHRGAGRPQHAALMAIGSVADVYSLCVQDDTHCIVWGVGVARWQLFDDGLSLLPIATSQKCQDGHLFTCPEQVGTGFEN